MAPVVPVLQQPPCKLLPDTVANHPSAPLFADKPHMQHVFEVCVVCVCVLCVVTYLGSRTHAGVSHEADLQPLPCCCWHPRRTVTMYGVLCQACGCVCRLWWCWSACRCALAPPSSTDCTSLFSVCSSTSSTSSTSSPCLHCPCCPSSHAAMVCADTLCFAVQCSAGRSTLLAAHLPHRRLQEAQGNNRQAAKER